MSGLHEVSVLNTFTIGPNRLQSHGAEAERRPSPEAVSDQIPSPLAMKVDAEVWSFSQHYM